MACVLQDLKAASRPLDRITENCFKVGDLKTNGIIPTEVQAQQHCALAKNVSSCRRSEKQAAVNSLLITLIAVEQDTIAQTFIHSSVVTPFNLHMWF